MKKYLYILNKFSDMVEKIEEWSVRFSDNKVIFIIVQFVLMVMAVVFVMVEKTIIGGCALVIWYVLGSMDKIVGWRESFGRWLCMAIGYNFFAALGLAYIICKGTGLDAFEIVFVCLMMLIWLGLSLVAKTDMAILINECISGISAAAVTIGTYLMSALERKDSIYRVYSDIGKSQISFNNAIESGKYTSDMIRMAFFWELLYELYLLLLPIIGLTAVTLVLLKLKKYEEVRQLTEQISEENTKFLVDKNAK
ncbi:MAG: hypothetical protein PUB19_01880 [Lachnospiraceae bacterium]|nr:hypothetical protein [Lachnospiraceae bacterium]